MLYVPGNKGIFVKTRSGLDRISASFPEKLRGSTIGLLCHAASVRSDLVHAIDVFDEQPSCSLAAVFGPQHGLHGQTQDNMVEWEGARHAVLNIPVYSLYGAKRKPTRTMLEPLDALVIDLQDVGARPYTYLWTVKLCLEACAETGTSVWILDRPNPIAAIDIDGPMISTEFFSFVGGAHLPLCHRMTLGEIGRMLQQEYFPGVDLTVVEMQDWYRNSLWDETGLPWVLPSPNMPTLDTALVYPGQVLLEATTLSEGRGTTRPFELFGAPYLDREKFELCFKSWNLPACRLRAHDFQPTFQKWAGGYCVGWQVHVTNAREYRPVLTTFALLDSARRAGGDHFAFNNPPYEYEYGKMPFDILAGDSTWRELLLDGCTRVSLVEMWRHSYQEFKKYCGNCARYKEESA
ncbi:MAG: DUF1343 domain-containing protein [Chitinivibrionales bacterium]|nr:DUF1343 domain-containing protein [Chitinivibrionales bacterium]